MLHISNFERSSLMLNNSMRCPFRKNQEGQEHMTKRSTIFLDESETDAARAEDCLTSPIAVVRSKKSDVKRVVSYPENVQMPIQGSNLMVHTQILITCHLLVFALVIIVIRSCFLSYRTWEVSKCSCYLDDPQHLHPKVYLGPRAPEPSKRRIRD